MRSGVIAQKVGMTRVYNDAGEHVPVTVLRMENCQVVSHRTTEKNGYVAVQLGAGQAKVKNTTSRRRSSSSFAFPKTTSSTSAPRSRQAISPPASWSTAPAPRSVRVSPAR